MDFLRELRTRLFGGDEQPTEDEPASTDALAEEVAPSPEDSLSPPVFEDNLTPPALGEDLTPLYAPERGVTPGDADPSGQSDGAAEASDDRIDLPLSAPDRDVDAVDIRAAQRLEGEVSPEAEGEVTSQAEAGTFSEVLDEGAPRAPDEIAPGAPPFEDAVPGRQERAASRILDEVGLLGDLTDDEYQPLLDWALAQTDALAASTGALDDEQADAAIEAGLVAIRDTVRAAQDSHTAPPLGEDTA